MTPVEAEAEIAGWGVRALIAALVLGVVAWLLFSWGESVVQARWDKAELARQNAVVSAVANRLQDNAALAAVQAKTSSNLVKGYTDEIKNLDSGRARGDTHSLRLPATICGGPTSAPETGGPGRSDAAPTGAGVLPQSPGADPIRASTTVEIPADIAAELRARADEADRAVASCRVAQGVIRGNGLAP